MSPTSTNNSTVVTSFVAGMATMYLIKKYMDLKQANKDRANGKSKRVFSLHSSILLVF